MPDADLVLIDTAGRSDPETIAHQMAMLRSVPGVEMHLVLSAATGAREIGAAARRYREHGIERLIFTKLDEADGPGQRALGDWRPSPAPSPASPTASGSPTTCTSPTVAACSTWWPAPRETRSRRLDQADSLRQRVAASDADAARLRSRCGGDQLAAAGHRRHQRQRRRGQDQHHRQPGGAGRPQPASGC